VSVDPDAPQSFLTKMVRAEKAGKLERRHMLDAIGANVAAGTDTTSITLSAAMYYVYRTPHVLAALRREIDEKAESGRISDPVTFAETQKMPYLQATIQEVLRMHPAVGYILPRVVPEGGVEIAGEWFPAGVSGIVNVGTTFAHLC
jgi:cytochrome P450